MSLILKNKLFDHFYFCSFLTIILLFTMGTATAVPANPAPFDLVQPDDFTFTAKLIGDEHGAHIETIEGYTIVEDDNKWWTYAQKSVSKTSTTSSTMSANYVLSATENRVGHVDPQQLGISKHIQPNYVSKDIEFIEQSSSLPLKSPSSAVSSLLTPTKPYYSAVIGTENAVVILINFTDKSQGPSYTPSHYDNLLFNQSVSANSMYNYYKEVSYGKLNTTGTVGPKWYQSNHTLSYYGADTGPFDSNPHTSDDGNTNIFELAREAVQLADANIDFSQYDKDSDGIVDHVIIVHAGEGQESSYVTTDIWSHKWTIYNYYDGIGWVNDGETVDGVKVVDYTMLAEDSPLGTFAHEFGHDLGLPDLYNTSSGGGTVVGSWCLMDQGSWNDGGDTPSHLSAWCKIDLGWIAPTLVNSTSTYFVNQVETNAEAYKVTTPALESEIEYFLVENRENVGYDQYLPDEGILIWHIDDGYINAFRSINRINAYSIKGIIPELPDGILDNAAYSANDGQISFNTTTTPNSNTDAGYISNVAIENIGPKGASMRVDFFGGDAQPPSFSNETPTNASFTNNQTPLISINITDTGIGVNSSTIVMKVNGSDVDETITPIADGFHVENLTAQSFADGQLVNVSVTASDNVSNSLTYNWSFTIDTTPPVVNITYPTEGLVIPTSTPNLNITTNKTSDIWYRIGNGTNISGMRGMTFNTTLPQLNDSHYNITAFARDLAGNLNSTMVNFTIFATPPVVSVPAAGEIFYIPQNTTYVNGTTTTIVTNVSVYVNSVLVNESHPVTGGMFNISGVPLVNGTNTINVTAIYNYTATEYFSENTSLTVSLGQIFDEIGDTITLNVPGLAQEIKPPFIDFNITGRGNNIPTNISSSVVAAASAPPASNITGPAIDFSVPGNESYTFDNSISLTLGFNESSVVNFNKTVVAWYDDTNATWVSLKSTVNTTANTTTANVTHFTVFAPLEDNTPPANITDLISTGQTTSSITLSWTNLSDTDYVEIWRSNSHFTNVSTITYTNIGLSSSTSYNYALRPVDIVGNKGNWTNVTVSTASPSSPPSSGGGGGGGTSGEEYENIEFKDVSRVYISANTDASFIFSEAGNDIQSINFKALTSAGYISATIEVLKDTSALVKQAPSGKVYKNMNIWVGKYGYATEKNIKDPVIGFKVQRSWIQDNRIDENSIKLNRYSEDVWTALPTTRTDEDATFVYFESQTPGFSPFAITAHEKTISSQVSIKSETVAESLSPVEEQPVETTTPDHEIESVEETSMWDYLLIGALILIVAAGAYLCMRKRQS